MRWVRRLLALLALVTVGVGALVMLTFTPYRGYDDNEVFVDIPRGTGSRTVGRWLEEQGVIRHRALLALAQLLQPGTIKAGEYQFTGETSPADALAKMIRGETVARDLLVKEGHNLFEIAQTVDAAGIVPRAEFLRAARDPALIKDLAPEATSLEGYLFPSTYKVPRKITAEALCRLMTDEFRTQWKRVRRASGDPLTVHGLVTLASLVEKETAVPAERPRVASVYRNRLRDRMLMNADPTVIYAALLAGHYDGNIRKSDLQSPHPYNTYVHTGLPPGPIANPGLGALQAAARPEESDYLYFVAKPDASGGHTFTRSLAEHNVEVAKLRAAGR